MSFLPENFKPEKYQDTSLSEGFKPLKGKYVCEIERVTVKEGTWASGDAYKKAVLMLRIKEVVSGDKGVNRTFFDETSLIDTTYNEKTTTAAEHAGKLISKLCTAGYDMDLVKAGKSLEDFVKEVEGAVGLKCNINAWVQGDKQRIKFVEEFSKEAVAPKSSDDFSF